MAEVAAAYVSLIPSAKGFARGVTRETDKAATTAGKSFGGKFASSVKGVLGGALVGIGVTKLISDTLGEAREAQKVGALTTQVIKSTGGAANVTAQQVGDLANAISKKVGVDDEAIQSGENMLLTFRNIRNEAGKGNDVFNQAVNATTDLAAAMAAASGGQLDFRSASIQLGKALNDPVKGMTALTRVGVTFTDKQKAVNKALVQGGIINAINAYTGATGDAAITSARFAKIQKDQKLSFDQTVRLLTGPMSAAQQKWFKHLQEGNHTAEAQKNILKELRKEFGGAAEAQATAGDKARVAFKNLEEQIGTALLPVVDDLANKVTNDVVPAVSKFITQMQTGAGKGGEFASNLKDIYNTGKDVVTFLNDLPGPVKKFAVEGGIALVVLSKMRALFGPSATALNGFVAGMANAETRMTTTAGAARRLGSGIQTLAGAGGLIALQDGAKKTDTVVGALETTLGGAAAGFAAGGPIGAAVGALGGLTLSLWQATKHAGQEAKVQIPSWKEYGTTLDGIKAKTTAATREMVLQRLEQSGLLDATRKLGLTDREAVNAMTGSTTAREKLAEALRHSRGLTDEQKAALERETGAVGAARLAQLKHNIAVAGSKEELQKARTALKNFMAEPASKRVSIEGVEAAKESIKSLRKAIRSLWSGSGNAGPKTSGSGGIDVLLDLNIKRRAKGGSVMAGQPYIVGENRPELFVPNHSGRIIPRVPKIAANDVAGVAPGGPLVNIEHLTPANYGEFMREVDKRARLAGLDGMRR